MKLHLGAGAKRWDGFVNVDLHGEQDVNCDIRKLPFDDNSADEIHSIHTVEHLYLREIGAVLTEWVRVLKPGGLLVIECPCADKVFEFIRQGQMDPRLVMWPMFGDPSTHKSEADLHKWMWTKQDLAMVMHECGLTNIKSETPKFHVPQRDMRIVGNKRAD